MVKKVINVGIEGNDATGDPIREAFKKTNENFTELYSVFGKGAGFQFTDLADYDPNRNSQLVENSIFIVNDDGDTILAKTLEGDGIDVILSDPNKITLKNLGSKLVFDSTPALGGILNATEFPIGNLKDADEDDATQLNVDINTFAITRGYANTNFVNVSGDTMTGALNVPAGATGTQVPRKQEVVGRIGGSANQMTGPLLLDEDPDENSNPLTAATKNYVDTTAFSSQVNLFVSTNGDDFRFGIVEEKRGSALAYAFKTLNRACFKAEQIVTNAAYDLGPYRKPIFYNNGEDISTVYSITNTSGSLFELVITNAGGSGTDMRGTGSLATADVRAGLLFRGTTSGAIAIVKTVGEEIDTVTNTENYTIEYKTSTHFQVGEELEYGDGVKKPNITIYIESGEYFENLPIRVPANVSIVGDDTRRVIIRPKSGPSGSIWSNLYFRRDTTIDTMSIVGQNLGYHYLSDSTKSIYSKTIYSPGTSLNAQKILNANRTFIQDEIMAYVDYRIAHDAPSGTYYGFSLTTDQRTNWHRIIGSIVDSIGFDLIYGNYSRVLEASMAFFSDVSSLKLVNEQKAKTLDIITRLGVIIKRIIRQLWNSVTDNQRSTGTVVTMPSITAEEDFDVTTDDLIELMIDVINQAASVNFPKNNDELDVFLLNDTNRIRTLTSQGHGGFMCVLDPEGQILTKSPYIFQCTSFAKSVNKQHFAGGVFVDAFCGNLSCTIETRTFDSSTDVTILDVSGLDYRSPQTPSAFILNGVRFQIDYISDFDITTGTATLHINPNTPDTNSYTKQGSILTPTTEIEIQTGGNRSMLVSDFTQINDLGYGIFANNGAFIEAVSIFCYYNYRAFYALNGSQIRSLNGSCGYGTYALSSEGADPTEIPTVATLKYPMIQVSTTYSTATLSTKNKENDLIVYVTVVPSATDYKPFNISELEIDHGSGVFGRYEVTSATASGVTNVWALNLSTAGNNNTITNGLYADVPNGTKVIIRNLQNFEALHLPTLNPTRPSTALQFDNDSVIYHVLSYTPVNEDSDPENNDLAAILTLSESYSYIQITPHSTAGLTSNSGQVGATRINVSQLSTDNISKVVGMIFAWGDTVHTITQYETPTQTGQAWGRITFTPALTKTTATASYNNSTLSLKAGLNTVNSSSQPVTMELTVQISVLRAGGHDLVDIGTGGFADSNIPDNIYGPPVRTVDQAKEVQEIGKGRVFYVTTDQYGNFRIGKFFRVDQGTGTVTFAASIALSNLDGIGFKRGVTVSEFSTDDSLTNNATDTVPTQSAVVGYVNKRLGFTATGSLITAGTGLGPGFMPRDGTYGGATGNMNMAGYLIQNLGSPSTNSDATTKEYVDLFLKRTGGIRKDINTFVMSASTQFTIYSVSRIGALIISTVARSSNVATVATTVAHGFTTGDSITISGTTLANFDTTATITVTTPTAFTYSNTGINVSTTSTPNTARATSSSRTPTATITLTDNSTLSGSHGFSVGSVVTIAGVDDDNPTTLAGFDAVSVTITAVPDAKSFTYTNTGVTTSTTTVSGATVTSISNIGMNSGKITNLGAPTSDNDAATKTYVDSAVAAKDQLSELSDITISSAANGNVLSYNSGTSKWVNTLITNTNISSSAAIAQSKLSLSSATAAATSGAATLGIASFNSNNFDVSSGFVSLKSGSVGLSSLGTIGSGYVLGNNSGVTASPTTVTFSDALNAGISNTPVGAANLVTGRMYFIAVPGNTNWTSVGASASTAGTVFTATGTVSGTTGTAIEATGVIVRGYQSGSTFSTVVNTNANQANTIVQRDNNGDFSARTLTVTSISASGAISGSSLSASNGVSGATITSTSTISAGTELQIFNKKIFDYNGAITRMFNQAGGLALEVSGTLTAPVITSTNGNIGLGTSSPAVRLHVSGSTLTSAAVYIEHTGNLSTSTPTLTFNRTSTVSQANDFHGQIGWTRTLTDSTTIQSQIFGAGSNIAGSASMSLYYDGYTSHIFRIQGSTRISIDSSGNIIPNTNNSQNLGNTSTVWQNVYTRSLSTGASGTAGTITGQWTLGSGSTLNSTYADLAEYYESDNGYDVGTVVMIGGEKEITISKGEGTTKVAGVVSRNPAFIMNEKCPGQKLAIALQGRVPCKVVGKIQKGDLLVTSMIPGVAMASEDPKAGSIIGKSLGNYNSNRVGVVEVLVGKH